MAAAPTAAIKTKKMVDSVSLATNIFTKNADSKIATKPIPKYERLIIDNSSYNVIPM
jgi:hypothetical protein